MNYRLNKTALYGVIALVVAAALIFGYTLISAPTDEQTAGEDPTSEQPMSNREERTITAQHQYVEGLHTVAGIVDMPTPCHQLIAEPFLLGEDAGQAEIRFTSSVEGDVCAQVITPARFKVTFEAREDVSMSATWNGAPATLNLVPVPDGEDLDDFEVYVKG